MTAPARISQAEIERALKALKAAGITRFRMVLNLNECTIEVFTGDTDLTNDAPNPWDQE